jgi:predicted ester cyclase
MNTSSDLEAMTRRFYAGADRADFAQMRELVSPAVRACMGGQALDLESWVAAAGGFMSAFPDGTHEILDLIVAGNQVVTRCIWRGTHTGAFHGIPATGRSITLNLIHIDRWVEGRIVEHDGQFDSLGLMQQLGVIPGAEAA